MLATVLFTDIVGSTERAAELGDARWRDAARAEHDRLVRARSSPATGGREIKTVGDGFLATFDGPARAVRCALRSSTSVARARPRGARRPAHRRGARSSATTSAASPSTSPRASWRDAGPGEVLASSTVQDLVVGSGLRFEDRGRHELRGVPGEWQLWKLAA